MHDGATVPKLPSGREESSIIFATVKTCIVSLVLPQQLQAVKFLGQFDKNKGAIQFCHVKKKKTQTNQQANNLAFLSFEQPFLSLVPFPKSLVRTVSIEIFKRCNLNSPVKTNPLLVVGAGCLQICGETKIVERELEGQITGDFFFFWFAWILLLFQGLIQSPHKSDGKLKHW